ncbi:hypothetical protein N0V88_003743 [Collariella sp. IMI 366227]|nr:hypothetical protein N0V88_003743 [Collariella sp. IMI 366227]
MMVADASMAEDRDLSDSPLSDSILQALGDLSNTMRRRPSSSNTTSTKTVMITVTTTTGMGMIRGTTKDTADTADTADNTMTEATDGADPQIRTTSRTTTTPARMGPGGEDAQCLEEEAGGRIRLAAADMAQVLVARRVLVAEVIPRLAAVVGRVRLIEQ